VAGYIERSAGSKMPRNLYYLTKYYLKERKTVIAINSLSKEKNITNGCPHGSCWLQPATRIPLQHNHTETPTHIEPRTIEHFGNSTE